MNLKILNSFNFLKVDIEGIREVSKSTSLLTRRRVWKLVEQNFQQRKLYVLLVVLEFIISLIILIEGFGEENKENLRFSGAMNIYPPFIR